MSLLTEILLGDFELNRRVSMEQVCKQRRCRLPDLEVDWSVLDLHNHVVVELAIQRLEEIDRGICPIGSPVTLVELVVNKRPKQYVSAMWL